MRSALCIALAIAAVAFVLLGIAHHEPVNHSDFAVICLAGSALLRESL